MKTTKNKKQKLQGKVNILNSLVYITLFTFIVIMMTGIILAAHVETMRIAIILFPVGILGSMSMPWILLSIVDNIEDKIRELSDSEQ